MKQIICTAALLAILAVSVPAQQAQQQAAAAPLPYQVAVVDLAQLVKKHPLFESKMSGLQSKLVMIDADFRKRQDAIRAEAKKLEDMASGQLKPGSGPYNELADQLTAKMTTLDIEAKKTQRSIALENSQIMYDTFMDIRAEIEAFAAKYPIAVVIDYRQMEVSAADPQTVAEEMEQKMVWHNKRLDITESILAQLKAKYPNAPAPAATASPGAPGAPVRQ